MYRVYFYIHFKLFSHTLTNTDIELDTLI